MAARSRYPPCRASADEGESWPADLESVLGATPQEFESLILRRVRAARPGPRTASAGDHRYGVVADVGRVDGAGRRVDRDPDRTLADRDRGGDRIGPAADHRHGAGAVVGDVDIAGPRV